MNPSLFYLKEIKKYPNSYFKKCKTSTCEPIFSSRKKINTEYDCKKKAFSSRVESPLILRDTLSNLMKDLLIQEAQPKQVNFKIKKNYYEKPFSTQLNQREIIREFQEIEKRASNHVSINELKARIHTSSTGSDELLIKRKDVLLNQIPARFNLKLPKTIDHCRKILAKKEFQGFQTISSQYNQKEMQINFSNFYQTYLKKVKLHKKTVSLQNERKNSKERKEFLQFSEKNKFENEKKSNNSQKPKADQPKTSSTRPSPLEKEENYNLLFTCKSFGPASPYLNLGNLNKQRTQKQFSQNIIQNKKSILENESPEKSQIKIPKENKNQNQNEKDFNDEEDYQIKEDKKVIAEMKTKFRNITNEENRRKGKSNLNLRKALRESLDYFASLKLDLKDVNLSFFFYQ